MTLDHLKSLLSTNQSDRLAKEKAAQDRIGDPNLPRHTVYRGDRKIQQLGQDTIENGVIINNQSVAIGEVMLPLAKGNVLRRVDKTNGGALLGTAYRDALENDYDANGNRRNSELGRNGGEEPPNPPNPNPPPKPKKNPPRFPPPFGCVPPPSQCFWSSSPTAPDGFQGYGDAVVNENAQPLYLYCVAGTSVPANLGCDFLNPPTVSTYSCSGGVCSPDPSGIYPSLAACQAALIPPPFTGGQCNFAYVYVLQRVGGTVGTRYLGLINATNGTVTAPLTTLGDAIAGARGGANANVYKPTGIINTTTIGATTTVTVGFERPLGSATSQGINLPANDGFPTFNPYTYSIAAVVPLDPLDIDNCGNLPPTCPT